MMETKAEKFTEQSWAAIHSAQNIAKESYQQNIETEHLLMALIEKSELTAEIINQSGGSMKQLKQELKDFNSKETFSKKDPITEWEKINTLDC